VILTPYVRARAVYETELCARSFDEDLEWHLLNGYVLSTPDVFVMARAVNSKCVGSQIVLPRVQFNHPDCWHIYLLAGDWMKAFQYIPIEYPLISWERKNKLRFYSYNRMHRYVFHDKRAFTGPPTF
jgi:hypothetical protein